ncbi:unnamed protein product, partial [Vitis vinifera]
MRMIMVETLLIYNIFFGSTFIENGIIPLGWFPPRKGYSATTYKGYQTLSNLPESPSPSYGKLLLD